MKKKLIRADSLLEQIESPYVEYPVMIGIRKAIKEMIDEAPEIEAIPVEWIEQRIKGLDTEVQSLYYRFRSQGPSKEKDEALLRCVEISPMIRAYETVLSEWRKENGTN